MYYKNICLHLAYLQTSERRKNYFCKKKKIAKLLFFTIGPLSHPFDSKILSVLFSKNVCLYYIHPRDVMPKT